MTVWLESIKNIKSHDEMIGYIKDLVKEEEADASMKDLMSLFKYSIGIHQKKPLSSDGRTKTIKTNKEIMEMLVPNVCLYVSQTIIIKILQII